MKKIMFENIKISLLNIKLHRFCQLLKTSHFQWRIIIAIMCSILLPGQKSQAQIYVDACAIGFFENGTMLFPYKTLAKAVEHAKAFPGSNIIMKGGVYAESLTISNVVTITAYDGSALLGGYNVGWRDVSL